MELRPMYELESVLDYIEEIRKLVGEVQVSFDYEQTQHGLESICVVHRDELHVEARAFADAEAIEYVYRRLRAMAS